MSVARSLSRRKQRADMKSTTMKRERIMTTKIFTAAEKERLTELASAAQAAVAEQDKFVNFLRKQHDATDESVWGATIDGFVQRKEPVPATPPPAPGKPKKSSKKADEIATNILYPDGVTE